MAFIDQDFIDVAIGAPLREKMTRGSASELTKMITRSDGRAKSALKAAGYTVSPGSYTPATTPIEIKDASLGYFIRMGYAKLGLDTPKQFEMYTTAGDALSKGEIQPDGIDPDPEDAIGGVTFSDSDSTIDGSFPPVFSRDALKNF